MSCPAQGDASGARRLTRTALGMVLASQVAIGLLAYHHGEGLVGLMTGQPDVLELAGAVLPVLAVCFVCECAVDCGVRLVLCLIVPDDCSSRRV